MFPAPFPGFSLGAAWTASPTSGPLSPGPVLLRALHYCTGSLRASGHEGRGRRCPEGIGEPGRRAQGATDHGGGGSRNRGRNPQSELCSGARDAVQALESDHGSPTYLALAAHHPGLSFLICKMELGAAAAQSIKQQNLSEGLSKARARTNDQQAGLLGRFSRPLGAGGSSAERAKWKGEQRKSGGSLGRGGVSSNTEV